MNDQLTEARKKKEYKMPQEYIDFVEHCNSNAGSITAPNMAYWSEYGRHLRTLKRLAQNEILKVIKDIGKENISPDKRKKLTDNLNGLERMKPSADKERFIRYFGNIFTYVQKVRESPVTKKRKKKTPTKEPAKKIAVDIPDQITDWFESFEKTANVFTTAYENWESDGTETYKTFNRFAEEADMSGFVTDYITDDLFGNASALLSHDNKLLGLFLSAATRRQLTNLSSQIKKFEDRNYYDIRYEPKTIRKYLEFLSKTASIHERALTEYVQKKETGTEIQSDERDYYPQSLNDLIKQFDVWIAGDESANSGKLRALLIAVRKELTEKISNVLVSYDVAPKKRDSLESTLLNLRKGFRYAYHPDANWLTKKKLYYIGVAERLHKVIIKSPKLGKERVDNINGVTLMNYSKANTGMEFWDPVIKDSKKAWDETFGNYVPAEDLFSINVRITDKGLTKKWSGMYTRRVGEPSYIQVLGSKAVTDRPDKSLWIFIHEICHKLWYELPPSGMIGRAREVYRFINTWKKAQKNYIKKTGYSTYAKKVFVTQASKKPRKMKYDLLTVEDFSMAVFFRFPTWYAETEVSEFLPEFLACCCYYVGHSPTEDLKYLDVDLVQDIYYPLGKYIMGGDKALLRQAVGHVKDSRVYKEIQKDYKKLDEKQFTEKYFKLYNRFDVDKIDKSRY